MQKVDHKEVSAKLDEFFFSFICEYIKINFGKKMSLDKLNIFLDGHYVIVICPDYKVFKRSTKNYNEHAAELVAAKSLKEKVAALNKMSIWLNADDYIALAETT